MSTFSGADPDKPDPKVDAQAAAVAKKNGFASLAEDDGASMNISMIMFGIDPQTKKFTEPPDQIKKQIAALRIDKSVSEAYGEAFAASHHRLSASSPSRRTRL